MVAETTETAVVKDSPLLKEAVTRKIRLKGLADIMFDRYAGDNNTKLEPHQKFYFRSETQRIIGIPSLNIMSFLSAHNTNSAPKRLRDKRKYKDICNAHLSFVIINPSWIPFLRNKNPEGQPFEGVPIEFGKFGQDEVDPLSGAWIGHHVARLEKGIPNPKERPILPLPWSLEFEMTILPNKEIKEQEIMNLMEEGGRAIGLGTFRGVFGKFMIDAWE